MKHLLPPFWLLFALLIGAVQSRAAYIIPYKFTIPGDSKAYSVLVILADHLGNRFGPPDALDQFLLATHHSTRHRFITEYRALLREWYDRQVLHQKRVKSYDVDVEVLKYLFQSFGPSIDYLSSDIVITEYRDFSKVLSMVRSTSEDAEGYLPEERVLVDAGQSPRWERTIDLQSGFVLAPDFFPTSFQKRAVKLTLPPKRRRVQGVFGGNVSAKNFSTDPQVGVKFLPHLLNIGWLHRIFSVTARRNLLGQGVFADRLHLGCLGTKMTNIYGRLNFETFLPLQNAYTHGADIYFMKVLLEKFPAGLQQFARVFSLDRDESATPYLIYDTKMALEMSELSSDCVRQILGRPR